MGVLRVVGGAIGVAIASTIAATQASTLLHQGAAPAEAFSVVESTPRATSKVIGSGVALNLLALLVGDR